MNVDLAKCVRMSSNARIKIINEFFPDFSEEMARNNLSDSELSLHAGAMCLYTATMLTKIYDKSDSRIGDFHGWSLYFLSALTEHTGSFQIFAR